MKAFKKETSSCCSTEKTGKSEACGCAPTASDTPVSASWITGHVETAVGKIPQIATRLMFRDTADGWKVRWNIGRMNYRVSPGLYAAGNPGPASPVLVSANYKLTFDKLRRELAGLNVWLLLLDTKGINVWCAAGKGTFGTQELVHRIAQTGLSEVVTHRKLILPQLGAPGVAAHEVLKTSGFRVVYGPVRAADIPAFLEAGLKATPAMREVRFKVQDRLVVAPVELVGTVVPASILFAVLLVLNIVFHGHQSVNRHNPKNIDRFFSVLRRNPGRNNSVPGSAAVYSGTGICVQRLATRSAVGRRFSPVYDGRRQSIARCSPAAAASLSGIVPGDEFHRSRCVHFPLRRTERNEIRGTDSDSLCGSGPPAYGSPLNTYCEKGYIMKQQYLRNVVTLVLEDAKCIGCMMCIDVCPHAVFEPDSGKVRISERDSCMECGACALNCPSGAITVRAGVGCAAAIISGRLRGTAPDCGCSSGKENTGCC